MLAMHPMGIKSVLTEFLPYFRVEIGKYERWGIVMLLKKHTSISF